MRIGVVTNRNLCSPWASAHFYIYRALRRLGLDVLHVAGKEIAAYHDSFVTRKNRRSKRGPQPTPFTEELTAAIQEDVNKNSYDILLALHASTVVPLLETACPVVYATDATAQLLNRYYPQRLQLGKEKLAQLEEFEQQTMAKASSILVPSEWAAESVRDDYGVSRDRIHAIEWGGNLDTIPNLADEPRARTDEHLRFLFVGLDWERKGGDTAVEVVRRLQAEGVNATLTVVGAAIPRKHRSPHVRSVGMLNRSYPEESAELDQLFQEADFYIHPAKAECYGHVLCEALGFGVPVIATNTGGISQCVLDGETGILLPPGASADQYVTSIIDLVSKRVLLQEMQTNAILDYRKRLNWDCWASRSHKVMLELLSAKASASLT